ncbi:WGR domain-containing protein [Pseudomonas sp. GX19020]|uniref:WGR domain-containing protein n=1 Tax=Pseudomonas sp. GX19020 TaxID=2942277 RepID=UPI0020197D05|nr:WGR domain-containing protein [Pseudomonas sp. GX19020]MCL4068933.1 WGR domain-containing protein [Pseudomonas sp. GX19020]
MDEPVHLQRIDPERNMRRFYAAEIQPTLFGGVSVVRRWGRIGGPGRVMLETFDHAEEAQAALTKLVMAKQRRGYRVEAG